MNSLEQEGSRCRLLRDVCVDADGHCFWDLCIGEAIVVGITAGEVFAAASTGALIGASAGAAAPVTAAAVTTLDRMSRRDVAPRSGRVGPKGERASSIMTSPPLIIPDRQAWRGLAARLSIRYPEAPVLTTIELP